MTEFNKGQRVSFDGEDGGVYEGHVEQYRRGWVMIDLDGEVDTGYGWSASKMMIKSSDVTPLD